MEGKPENVRRAQLVGDHLVLVEMGRNGAKQAQLNRASAEKRRLAILEEGMRQNRYQANEHIVTPDGEEGEFPDGVIHSA